MGGIVWNKTKHLLVGLFMLHLFFLVIQIPLKWE